MASPRKIVFENEYIYHVFNRGVEKRTIFLDRRDHTRFLQTVKYYRHTYTPVRYTQLFLMTKQMRADVFVEIERSPLKVEILAYCLMPNHFHFLIRQKKDQGISTFVSNLSNSYARYFNQKHDRTGPLYQGRFKAVFIETEEQLIHVSRYIHLNPAVSSMVSRDNLANYKWSSLPDYLGKTSSNLTETKTILSYFSEKQPYENFLLDHLDYAKQLDIQKHLNLD